MKNSQSSRDLEKMIKVSQKQHRASYNPLASSSSKKKKLKSISLQNGGVLEYTTDQASPRNHHHGTSIANSQSTVKALLLHPSSMMNPGQVYLMQNSVSHTTHQSNALIATVKRANKAIIAHTRRSSYNRNKNDNLSISLAVGTQLYSLAELSQGTPKHMKTTAKRENTATTKLRRTKSKHALKKTRPVLREPMNFSLLPPINDSNLKGLGVGLQSPPPRRKKKKKGIVLLSMERDQFRTSQVSVEEPLEAQARQLQQISTTSVSSYIPPSLEHAKKSIALTSKSEKRPLDIFEQSNSNFASQLIVTEDDLVMKELKEQMHNVEYDTTNNSAGNYGGTYQNNSNHRSAHHDLPKDGQNSALNDVDSLHSFEFNSKAKKTLGNKLYIKPDHHGGKSNSNGQVGGNVPVLPALNIKQKTSPQKLLQPISQQIERRRRETGRVRTVKEIKMNLKMMQSEEIQSRSSSRNNKDFEANKRRNFTDSKVKQILADEKFQASRSRQVPNNELFSKTVDENHLKKKKESAQTITEDLEKLEGFEHMNIINNNAKLLTMAQTPLLAGQKNIQLQSHAQLSTLRAQELRMRKLFEQDNKMLLPPTTTKFAANKRQSAATLIATLELNLQRNSTSMQRLNLRRETALSQDSLSNRSNEVRTPRLTIKEKYKPKADDFEMKNRIGAGTFGVIVRAIDKKTQAEFAVKKIDKAHIQSRQHAEHIVREKKVLMYLSDPKHYNNFIVKAYASFHDKKSVHILMDFVKGCDLLSRIRGNEKRVKDNMDFYVAEILCTLEHLHSNLIIYRDLKPEHVMIDNEGHCKLVDFGFAKKFSQRDVKNNSLRTFTNCGTPDYIAPEILRGIGASFQADVWSLGVLMVEILSGKTPFFADNPQQIYENVIQCRPRYTTAVPSLIRVLLKTIFVQDPHFRATLDQIKKSPYFSRIDWEKAASRELPPPFVPNEAFAYHNCNDRAQIVSRGALTDGQNFAPFAVPFLQEADGAAEMSNPYGYQTESRKDLPQTIHDNQFVKLQKEVAMQAAMNINMPMAKGIVDDAFLEKNKVVSNRKKKNPLGNFWQQNLDQIFQDF